jgi:hypothetical protein
MRPGRYMTVVIRNAILILAGIVIPLVASATRAEAEPTGIVVVTGKIAARERNLVEVAIVKVLRRASWSMSAQAFSPKETEVITKCLADDQPWRCLSPLMQPKGVDRIVVVEVRPEPANKLNIIGEFVVAGDAAAAVVQRRCDACDNEHLDAVTQKIAEDLLREMAARGETTLDLHTVPGATAQLDGVPIGTADPTGKLSHTALPGPHKLAVQYPGFVDGERTVELPVAQATAVTVDLVPASSTGHPLLVPVIVAGAGALAIAGGIALQLDKDPPPMGEKQTKYVISAPGLALIAAGGVTVGLGAYLWVRATRNAAPTSMPTVAVTNGGGIVGWTGHF